MVAMPRPRPLHVHRETSRHGRTVWYVRIGKGPRIRLRAEFGSPEFEAAEQILGAKSRFNLNGFRAGRTSKSGMVSSAPDPWTGRVVAFQSNRVSVETVSVSGKRNSEGRDSSAKIRRCPLLVSAETRTRRLQVPAREHSTLDELDPSRNEPYRAIDRNRALKGKTYP